MLKQELRERALVEILTRAQAAAEAGREAEVPILLAAAREHIDDGELDELAGRYCEFFALPRVPDEAARGEPGWLGRRAGAALDGLHRHLIRAYREAGPSWELAAMEWAFLLEPSLAHHQVLADWLVSRGTPRGEFIALQMAYADHGLDARGRARMEALLRAHIHDWAAPFVGRGAAVLAFRRGFPAVVDQGHASVASLSELGLRWRTVSRVIGRDAPQLRACRHLGSPWDG